MITPTDVAGLFADPDWSSLIEEYAAEHTLPGMPPASARFANYEALEKMGVLHSLAARVDERLVGFLTILACPIPHYDRLMCSTESFFVAKAYRSHLIGLKLLAAAEDKARALKSPGLLVSAPFGGNLWELLPKCRYQESNRVFFKPLGDA